MAVTTTFNNTTTTFQFGVNTFTPGNQIFPDVLGLDNGGFAAAYNTASGNFILLNFYDANSNQVGGFRIPYDDTNTEPPGKPSLTKLANGNVLVVWDDNNPAETFMLGRIFDQNGNTVGGELKLSGSSISFEDPVTSALASGGFAISFTFGGNVFVGRYNAFGSQLGGFTQVNTVATAGTQNDASIVGLADGGFVVTYTDTNPANQPLRAAIYNADGTVRTADFLIDNFGDNTQSALTALPNGNWAVVYTDSGWVEGGTLGNGITLEIFNANGVSQTGFIKVNTTSTVDEVDPDISVLSNGFIVVSWTKPFNATTDDIFARIFDQNGNALSANMASEFAIAAEGADRDVFSALGMLQNGKFITVWQDAGDTDGGGGRITGEVNQLSRTSVSDAASDTITIDSLRDIASGNAGNDTFQGGGLGAFTNDLIDGGADADRILATGDISLVDTTVISIEEIEFQAVAPAKLVVIRADQVGAGLAANLVVDFAAVGTPDRFRVEMLSATTVDLSQFQVQDFFPGAGEADQLIILGDNDSETMRGTSVRDELNGLGGDDLLDGGAGGDLLDGGNGSDRATYVNATAAVVASLTSPAGNTGEAAGDTYSSIENLTGSNFNDRLTGTNGANSIIGAIGNDAIFGLGGNDSLFGQDGNDNLIGGAGADILDGGAGGDRASYATATVGVVASLVSPAANTGDAAGDTFISIENLTGSNFNDRLTGTNGANNIVGAIGNDAIFGLGGNDSLFGQDGNDNLIGGAGADILDGGAGGDRASYATATVGVVASLVSPAANTGDAAGDTFISIENLTGSNFNDTLTGTNSANSIIGATGNDTIFGLGGNDSLFGQDGNDTLIGGAGADALSGGNGSDRASYQTATAGVVASLTTPASNTGDAAGDTYSSIENLTGSAFNDTLTGNSSGNILIGGSGNDTLNGRAGNDTLTGGGGNDTFLFNTALGATNVDTITDFSFVNDTIRLENAIFNAIVGVGVLSAAQFVANVSGTASDSSDRIIYETDTGKLFYDTNGNAAGGSVQFAKLDPGLGINNTDFFII
ncbi:calcium-binding protein [Shinella sp. CPCC 101442]|uniref:beta strand repeat-containing protein n=1 Tax=Shinella sp. CPCC 101442 TaxID=2932265 RepID=UPI002152C0C6|nr:calcium-binding protein [Shinella sp. CPCC 101442]MCR6500153.1 calcium-binding protein [Shinella sp. CPCC 101442]